MESVDWKRTVEERDTVGVDANSSDEAVPPNGARRAGSGATLERLREMILSGDLEPGSTVSQRTLARSLGISTTPLREVIRELQAEGLMEIAVNRRPRVAPLDIDDLHGVYAGRIVLESLAISLTVPEMTQEDLDGLAEDLVEMHELANADDHPRWLVAHLRFHRRLLVGAPASMATSITTLLNQSERYRRLMDQPRVRRSLHDAEREHGRIADACVRGDSDGAACELANHLAQTALGLSAAFAATADPKAVRQAVRMVWSCRPAVAPSSPANNRARRVL